MPLYGEAKRAMVDTVSQILKDPKCSSILTPLGRETTASALDEWLEHQRNPGSFSDGYHTVDELYDHRVMLWITLCRVIGQGLAWRSWTHSDGSAIPDFFLLGLGKQQGTQMTYHLPSRHWEQTEFAETLERAPEFDGHTSADVLRRLDLIRALQADG